LSQPGIWQDIQRIVIRDRKTILYHLASSHHDETIFVGCGTSYYLSLAAASMYSLVTGQRTKAVAASEVIFFFETVLPEAGDGYMPILISRSGTTTEVLRAAAKIKHRLGDVTFGISCRPDSDLAQHSRFPLVSPPADEKSVVMTRSFTSMLLLIQYLAALRSNKKEYEEELAQLPGHGEGVIDSASDTARQVIELGNYSKFVFLGQGPYYGLACEAMLKMKEMSLSVSEAYHSLEYRHGPMSLVDDNMLLTFLISERARDQEKILLKEMKTLGADTLAICERADPEIEAASDYLIELRSGLSDEARLILYMPLLQLLAYYNSVAKGLDPDNPKHLTQVVTLT
jgi:glucosamine--fructose-6-phosphate aminotransferase (isomerizing)